MYKIIIENMEKIIINVFDYTIDPGPRYKRQDKQGETNSGEEYYTSILNKTFATCYNEGKKLVIYLDEVSGYPSSFLDEAIGELVYDFSKEVVSKYLSFKTIMFKRRVKQVEEETYPQWEERRRNQEKVVHSPELHATLTRLSLTGEIETYKI